MMLILLLSCLGSVFIVTRSTLFEALRARAAVVAPFASYVIRCPQCAGFWHGVAWSIVLHWSPMGDSYAARAVSTFAAGCSGSFVSHAANLLLERVSRQAQSASGDSAIARSPVG